VVAVSSNGSVIEMATVGREGCTGMQAFFGAKSSSVRLLVQISASATKMSRAAFARAMEAVLPRSHVRLRTRLSGAGHGVGGVQHALCYHAWLITLPAVAEEYLPNLFPYLLLCFISP
jgi:hypothetical protein